MKVPISWLNDYVEISDLSVRELADRLTFSGVEVESIDEVGARLDDNFVVGRVVSAVAHENSDHLSVCVVNDGTAEFQVVCGAPNVCADIMVPFARVGAVIPGGGFKIKRARLRGVDSHGMICSAAELCLAEESDGIMIFDESVCAGTPLRELLPPPETVLDLEITWNRSDCLSIIGIAREFAALLSRPLKLPAVDFVESEVPVDALARIKVEAPDLCPRYTARVLSGVRDGVSPLWMRCRLEMCGVRAISLTVDVTNYVMLETGQPLHAFDLSRLAAQSIFVRRATEGEKIKTLDGIERELNNEMLVIADAERAVAVAGVMGGEESEINREGSEDVLLESALFDAASVKFTASKLGIATESCRRFERGVDPDLADFASRRATALLVEHAGAQVAQGMVDCDSRNFSNTCIELSFERVRQIMGVALSDDEMIRILESLSVCVEERSSERALCVVPSWRLDLTREADLIEEIARLYGLNKVPSALPRTAAVSTLDDSSFYHRGHCRELLLGLGFTEAMHYSFLSAKELDAFDKRNVSGRALIPNPVSTDYGVLRDSLLPQMAASLGRNASRQVESAALFEIGRVFRRDDQGAIHEDERVALGIMGPRGRAAIDRRRPVTDEEAVLWLKGAVEALTDALHAGELTFTLSEHPAMERGWCADIILNGECIGCVGLLAAALRHHWRMSLPMPLAELRLAPLLSGVGKIAVIEPIPAYPAIKRDVAFISDSSVTHHDVLECIRAAAPEELTKIELFDIFVSKEIGKGRRSLGYTLSFRSTKRTLTDQEVNESFVKIVRALKEKLKVDIRDS
jgi:phenylalanyl-tRNA synthetase beta chain